MSEKSLRQFLEATSCGLPFKIVEAEELRKVREKAEDDDAIENISSNYNEMMDYTFLRISFKNGKYIRYYAEGRVE
jgi:predicted PhzF superfamily epimerase YddE/YHI9